MGPSDRSGPLGLALWILIALPLWAGFASESLAAPPSGGAPPSESQPVAAPPATGSDDSASGPAPSAPPADPAPPIENGSPAPDGTLGPDGPDGPEGPAAPTGDADSATTPPAAPPKVDPVEAARRAGTIEALQRRASRLRDLIAGQLKVDVDARKLFELRFDDPFASELLLALETPVPPPPPPPTKEELAALAKAERAAAREAKARARRGEPPLPEPEPEPVDELLEARIAVHAAWLDFFALAPELRRARLDAHAAARSAAGYRDEDLDFQRGRLARFRKEIEVLRAFLAGELPPEVDIRPLLRVDLLDPYERARQAALLGRPDTEDGASETDRGPQYQPRDDRPVPDELADASAELQRLRARYLALSATERAALRGHHLDPGEPPAPPVVEIDTQQAEAAVDEAARARQAALKAAAEAKTAALRRREEARATLLGVESSLGEFELELAGRSKSRADDHEALLQLEDDARAVEQMSPLDGDPSARAAQVLARARKALGEATQRLDLALIDLREAKTPVPALLEQVDGIQASVFEDPELASLKAQVLTHANRALDRADGQRWPRVVERLDDLLAYNQIRLRMLGRAPSETRARLTGFGPDGIAEALAEIEYVTLDLRTWTRAAPRRLAALWTELGGSPVGVLREGFKFFFAIFVFIAWRRRAPHVLEGIGAWARTSPVTQLKIFAVQLVRYLPYVRKPLEWLILAWVILHSMAQAAAIPGAALVWNLAAWLLGGLVVVRSIHAFASESGGRRHGDPTAALRLRSLRVVGLSIVLVGLILSTTSATVGRGTIYAWVISTCWFLAAPIFIVLIGWWQPVTRRRLTDHAAKTPLVNWVIRTKGGIRGFIAAGVGGVYLLITGVRRYLVRRASYFEVTRRVLAYLVRREVARQAEVQDDRQFHALNDDEAPQLGRAFQTSPAQFVMGPLEPVLSQLAELTRESRSTICAIVGESGAGKTTLCRYFVSTLPERKEIFVDATYADLDGVVARLAEQLELPAVPTAEARAEQVSRSLRDGKYIVVIDDAQRLVRPTIGGLASLDALLDFARDVGDGADWFLVIEDPAWHYVKRARVQGATFDAIVQVPRWNETQLGEFLRNRSQLAGIAPSFEGLEVPRQATDDDDLSEGERCEQGYYRILWDYVDGNPAAALHWWRASVFRDQHRREVVRLFAPPRAAELEDMPASVYFVLRAIVQLDGATTKELVAATQLSRAEVENSLRYAASRRFTQKIDGRVFLTANWFRAITRVLWRRHLLLRSPG